MRLYQPLRPRPGAALAGANPLARITAALLLMIALFISVDPVTPSVVLAAALVAIPLSGLSSLHVLARTWPLLLAATAIAVLNVLFAGSQHGAPVLLGPLTLGAGTMLDGLALGLRVLAIALTGVLALAPLDPTDLADALQLQLHAPPRLAVGALAAVRLIPILAEEWQILGLARRARGIEAGHNPLEALRTFAGQLLALLVAALRRATRLATAMDARGFGSVPCRTVAREQRMQGEDWWLVVAAAAVALGAIALSVVLGTWRFLLA